MNIKGIERMIIYLTIVSVFCLTGILAFAQTSSAQDELMTMIVPIELRGNCGPPEFPSTAGNIFINEAVNAGMHVSSANEIPLVSREFLEYSIVSTSEELPTRFERIFAVANSGGGIEIKSSEGKTIVLKVDIKSVCWDIDKNAIIEKARELKLDYIIIVSIKVDDLTSEVNAGGQFGKQKSIMVQLDMQKMKVKSGKVTNSFSESKKQMDVSTENAIRTAVKYLAQEGVKSFLDGLDGK